MPLTVGRQESIASMAVLTTAMDHSHGALGDTLCGDGAVLLALFSPRSILLDYCESWHTYLFHDLSAHTVLERLYELGPGVC